MLLFKAGPHNGAPGRRQAKHTPRQPDLAWPETMHTLPRPRFLHSGDTAMVVEFGHDIDRQLSALVLSLARKVQAAAIPGVIEAVPTFRSVMVHYDPLIVPNERLKQLLEPLLDHLAAGESTGRLWRLPACYDETLGPDLAHVALSTGLTVKQVIERHSAAIYHVYMLGFLPSFPYMGDLAPELQLPRRKTPRIKVARGAIAIATTLTCIYTLESPGGWHLLGSTPAPLWDLRRDPPAPLAAGDKVAFAPISLREYEALLTKAADGDYQLTPEDGAGQGSPP
jgi:inhibitor of KinA